MTDALAVALGTALRWALGGYLLAGVAGGVGVALVVFLACYEGRSHVA